MLLLRIVRLARRVRAQRSVGFFAVALLLTTAIVGNALCFRLFDGRINPDIGWGDAFWYSLVSITTIGYGDIAAQTTGARLGTLFFVVMVGLTSFSLFFGMAVDAIALAITNAQKGLGRAMAKDHILIVHFPSEQRVLQLIEELRSDPAQGEAEIVVISDAIDELPFSLRDVMFVRGSSHDVATYERARARECRMSVVLSPDYGNRDSDAIVAAAVSVIDRVNADIYIVAECIDEKHRPLFDSCNADAVVLGMTIAGNLLIQEVHDPGIAQLVEVMTSNQRGTTLFSVEVGEAGIPYVELAAALLRRSVNVMAVNRGERTETLLAETASEVGDRIVYAAKQRHDWKGLRTLAGV